MAGRLQENHQKIARKSLSGQNVSAWLVVYTSEGMNRTDATRPANQPGDPRVAELLAETFARYQDELLGMLYYRVGNTEDARDAFQEAFLKCWRRRSKVGRIDNLKAWVFRVAMNAGRDIRGTAWRRRRRPLAEKEAALPSGEPGPEAELARNEQLDRIRLALLELRPEEQEVFLLRQNAQMTYQQIADSIEIPLGTVKTRMRLALGNLREALEPEST